MPQSFDAAPAPAVDMKVSHTTVQAQTVVKLREAMLCGAFRPGERLVQGLTARISFPRAKSMSLRGRTHFDEAHFYCERQPRSRGRPRSRDRARPLGMECGATRLPRREAARGEDPNEERGPEISRRQETRALQGAPLTRR
jgi:hypothetical protein